MHVTRIVLNLFVAALLGACSSAPSVRQTPEWSYEKDAISLHFYGDPQLNLFQKQTHSLIVCLYQLKDPNGFSQLVDEKDGLSRLLECSRFDPSVTYAKRLVVQPNQNLSELLDRTEGARFVGVVAGYYTLKKEGSTRSFAIPVTELPSGSVLVQKPARMSIDLNLGPREIRKASETQQTAKP